MSDKLKFWERLLWPVLNQRGELSVNGADEDFSKEELEALGLDDKGTEEAGKVPDEPVEKKPLEQEPEPKGEPTGQEPKREPGKDTDETKENFVPQARVDEITRARREAEEKLQLLVSDPEAFYQRYPDTPRPQQQRQPQIQQPQVPKGPENDWDKVIEGGDYNGRAFRDVYAIDPDYCFTTWPRIASHYQWHQFREQERSDEERRTRQTESEREAQEFQDSLASEMFSKQSMNDLTVDETAQINRTIQNVLGWIDQNNFYVKKDMLKKAYLLMDPEKALARAKSEAANKLIEQTQKGRVQTISARTESAPATGWEYWEQVSEADAVSAIDKMSEREYEKFLRTAPKSVRDRKEFQYLPWV